MEGKSQRENYLNERLVLTCRQIAADTPDFNFPGSKNECAAQNAPVERGARKAAIGSLKIEVDVAIESVRLRTDWMVG